MSLLDKQTLNELYRYGIAVTNNPSDAEDVLQTAIERFLKNQAASQTSQTREKN